MEVDSIPQQTQEKAAQIDSADLVVGVLADLGQDGLMNLCEGLRALPGPPRIVVLRRDPPGNTAATNAQSNQEDTSLSLLPWSAVGPDPLGAPLQSISIACQSLFAATGKLGARACCFVASEMESAPPRWVCQLLRPLLESEFDFVAPYYMPRMFQGLLNSGIVYPLTRCLYGKRIHNPFGPDVGISRKLAQKILGMNRNANAGRISRILWRRLRQWPCAKTCKFARSTWERVFIRRRIGRT